MTDIKLCPIDRVLDRVMQKLKLDDINNCINIQQIDRIYQNYPIYINEMGYLVDNDRWVGVITLMGPTVEFIVREILKLAYSTAEINELKKLSFEEVLETVSKKTGKSEISMSAIASLLLNERNDELFRNSTPGYRHHFCNYIENRLEEEVIELLIKRMEFITDIRNKINHGDWRGFIGATQTYSGLKPEDEKISMIEIDLHTGVSDAKNPSQQDMPTGPMQESFISQMNNPKKGVKENILRPYYEVMYILNHLFD
ncbi:MAG: hypothetical protein HC932_00125 [Thermales bacterium]|nr:hypothetical protein [Thermales bacterium]